MRSAGGRPTLLALGAAGLAVAWLGPLPEWASRSFTAHMAMHMSVVAVVAPLLALGLAGGAWDPVRRVPRLFSPVPASVLELVVVWGWHAPALHGAAREGGWTLALEQGSFLAAGLLVWLSAFGGDGTPERRGAGTLGLLLTSMHMTLLGALLGLSSRTLYPHLHGVGGMGPLEDQHLGGALMLLVGGAVYLAGGLALMAGVLREGRPAPPEGDGPAACPVPAGAGGAPAAGRGGAP